jgi:hypothetical protein
MSRKSKSVAEARLLLDLQNLKKSEDFCNLRADPSVSRVIVQNDPLAQFAPKGTRNGPSLELVSEMRTVSQDWFRGCKSRFAIYISSQARNPAHLMPLYLGVSS